jgi:phage-related protein
MAVPTSELQKVNPSSIIELFEVELTSALHGANFTYRFHAGVNPYNSNGDIIWAGNTYSKYPIDADL